MFMTSWFFFFGILVLQQNPLKSFAKCLVECDQFSHSESIILEEFRSDKLETWCAWLSKMVGPINYDMHICILNFVF